MTGYKAICAALGTGLALAFAGPAGAVTINQGLTSGVINTVEDQDREAYIDVDQDNNFSTGDVFVGFVRIDNFLPAGLDSNNQVYGVFTNQVLANQPSGDPDIVSFGTTTAAGLTLDVITQGQASANGMFAIYDSPVPYGTNLINNSAPGATTLKDDIDFIVNNGTLRLVIGIDPMAGDNFFTATQQPGFGLGTSNDTFDTLSVAIQAASFQAGLNVLAENVPGFIFQDLVPALDPITGGQIVEVGIANGAARGAFGDGNEAVFTNASGYTALDQCDDLAGGSDICGFVTDADFFLRPLAVPEPGTLALMGVALIGMGAVRRRKTKA